MVAKVLTDFAKDGAHGKSGEGLAAFGIESINGMDQADGSSLNQVIQGLTAVGVALGKVTNKWLVQHDQCFTKRCAGRIGRAQSGELVD